MMIKKKIVEVAKKLQLLDFDLVSTEGLINILKKMILTLAL